MFHLVQNMTSLYMTEHLLETHARADILVRKAHARSFPRKSRRLKCALRRLCVDYTGLHSQCHNYILCIGRTVNEVTANQIFCPIRLSNAQPKNLMRLKTQSKQTWDKPQKKFDKNLPVSNCLKAVEDRNPARTIAAVIVKDSIALDGWERDLSVRTRSARAARFGLRWSVKKSAKSHGRMR